MLRTTSSDGISMTAAVLGLSKVVPGGETTVFVYDAGGALAAEYSTQVEPGATAETAYLTTDHLGSPRVITDAEGEVISRRDFMPFGEELNAGVGPRTENLKYSTIGSDRVRQRFTGYEKDDETDLDFAEARMYQNRHGRFTAPDPLLSSASATDPQSFNRYTYTGNNPINYTDPSGLDWCGQGGSGPGGFDDIRWVSGSCGTDWKTIKNGTTVACNASTCDVNGRTYRQGEDFTLLDGGASQLVSPSAVTQGQNAAAASGNVSTGTATEAATSGASSGGVVAGGVTQLPTAAAGPPLLPLCTADFPCNSASSSASIQTLDISKNAPLKSVEGIARLAEGCSLIPGLGAPCGIVAAIVRGGQGNLTGAGDSLLSVVPGLSWLRKADKAVEVIQFTRSNLKLGQQMHKAYKAADVIPGVAIKEFRGVKGIRPDFVDFSTRTIYELKPFNPRGLKSGAKQLEKYKRAFEKSYPGTTWKTILDTY